MSDQLPERIIRADRAHDLATVGTLDLIAMFLGGRNENNREAYGRDLDRLAEFLGLADRSEAIEAILSAGHGQANATALQWRQAMERAGLAPSNPQSVAAWPPSRAW
jgi:hypothetical protein